MTRADSPKACSDTFGRSLCDLVILGRPKTLLRKTSMRTAAT
jgi:hypothetical protein